MNTCQNVDRMLLKNAKSIDKSDDIERLFKGFGGTSFVFQKSGKYQASVKKYFKTVYKDKNFELLNELIRKVVFEKL